MQRMRKLVLLAAAMAAAGCSSVPRRSGGEERNVEIFTSGHPTRPFTEVCRLNVYLEKTRTGQPTLEDVLPEVKRRAALCGADAIIDVDWKLRGTSDAGIYQVKATAIAFSKTSGLGPAKDREIEVLGASDAQRPFTRACNLDLYVEKTTPGEPALQEVLPEVKRQARLCGANAVAEVQWTLQGAGDARVYHVTAVGVVLTEKEPPAK
jgi:uncharacterized protein YbjQ (UPF0145 family)